VCGVYSYRYESYQPSMTSLVVTCVLDKSRRPAQTMQSCNFDNELRKEKIEYCLSYESFEMAPPTNAFNVARLVELAENTQ
jgi:hypothetical protein